VSETGKPVIIPTSSGALATEEWRRDPEERRRKASKAYEENRIRYSDLIERAKREKAGE
jgi:hypothetical protein